MSNKLDVKDTETVKKFYEHFNLPLPATLVSAMKDFEASPNGETENRFIIELAAAVTQAKTGLEEIDSLFADIADATGDLHYDLTFDRDVADALGRDEKELYVDPATTTSSDQLEDLQVSSQDQLEDLQVSSQDQLEEEKQEEQEE